MPYLVLWHGHSHPDEELDGRGEDGPVFGPFPFFYITYHCDIKFDVNDGHVLRIVAEFIYYDGVFYGDWSFVDQLDHGLESRLVAFDAERATLPACSQDQNRANSR